MVDIHQASPAELEQLLEEYPWFNVARKEYILRQLDNPTEENVRNALRHCGIFLLSRSEFIKLTAGKPISRTAHAEKPGMAKQQYFVVGGDYFGKEDFEALEQEGLAVQTPSFCQMNPRDDFPEAKPVRRRNTPDDICTETLAGIYFQQEIYPKAIEIYEKLILLYPEKSAYFASLIEKVKNIK